MKTRLNKENIRKFLTVTVSPGLLNRISWGAVSAIAFFALAAFGVWPIVVLIPTLRQCSFDRMIDLNMDLLDKILFPLVVCLSIAVYTIALEKSQREKRALRGIVRNHPAIPLFLTLVVWMVANIWLSGNGITHTLMHGSGLKHESFPLHLEYFLCFLPIGLFLRNPRLKLWLLRGMTIVSVILAFCMPYLYDNLHASLYYYDWAPMYATIFTNPNYYGYFLGVFVSLSAALFACAESRRWRWLYAFALVVNTYALSYSRARSAWVGALCACLFLVAASRVRDGKFRVWPVAALGLFVSVLCLTGLLNGKLIPGIGQVTGDINAMISEPESYRAVHAASGRMIIWKNTLAVIRDHPFVGIGFEGIHVRNLRFVGNARPHNEVMQYALFYGIPGAILYVLACASVYLQAWKRRKQLDSLTLAALTAATGYLVGSLFGLTVYNTAPYLFIMLGLGYAWGEEDAPPAASGQTEGASAIDSAADEPPEAPDGGASATDSAETASATDEEPESA